MPLFCDATPLLVLPPSQAGQLRTPFSHRAVFSLFMANPLVPGFPNPVSLPDNASRNPPLRKELVLSVHGVIQVHPRQTAFPPLFSSPLPFSVCLCRHDLQGAIGSLPEKTCGVFFPVFPFSHSPPGDEPFRFLGDTVRSPPTLFYLI